MGKPRMIILIRHAQSEGNKNRDIHQTVPDHRVKLTPDGWKQAAEAGVKLRSLLRSDDTLHFFTSPYRRTRETTEGILNALTADTPTPSPFPRNTIKVYEEPRLREQDFGNFQPGSAEMSRMWQERADYGHFFYRIPDGESAADAYDRISGFNESLWRSFGEEDFASVCVLVTHGLMTRVFLMKWYHFSVEYFEDLRNVNHCEFVVMKLNPGSGKFILQNQLRTWSQLRRERAEAIAPPESPIPVRKRWGDSQDSCDAGGFERRQQERRQNTADLFLDEATTTLQTEQVKWTQSRKELATQGLLDKDDGSREDLLGEPSQESSTVKVPIVSPSSIGKRILSPSTQAILNAGRDGGGSQSGAASEDDEDDGQNTDSAQGLNIQDSSITDEGPNEGEQQHGKREASRPTSSTSTFPAMSSMALALHGGLDGTTAPATAGDSISPKRARADALGDQSDVDDDDD